MDLRALLVRPLLSTIVLIGTCALLAWAPSVGATTTARTSPAPCASNALAIWLYLPPGGGTAGAVYEDLEFTNLSAHACSLSGYPGVSAFHLGGHQLGSAAVRSTSPVKSVTLKSGAHEAGLPPFLAGATATAILRITDVGALSPTTCKPTTAAGLRVYAPGAHAASVVTFPFVACARSGPRYLNIEAVQKGVVG